MLLDAVALWLAEGHAAAAAALTRALELLVTLDAGAGEARRWLWLASGRASSIIALELWDFDSWQETIYLLRSPANARRLMEAVARDKSHQAAVVKTMEDLQALAGE